jgi:hypothetical protein
VLLRVYVVGGRRGEVLRGEIKASEVEEIASAAAWWGLPWLDRKLSAGVRRGWLNRCTMSFHFFPLSMVWYC